MWCVAEIQPWFQRSWNALQKLNKNRIQCKDEILEVLQEDSDPLSPLPSSGQRVNYQTDPRPHFGVAWSSHSTCRPLWGSEGPCWGQRNQEVPDQTHTCPHCNLGLPADTLRWHEVGTDACKHTQTQIETGSQFPPNIPQLMSVFARRASDRCLSPCTGQVSAVWRAEELEEINTGVDAQSSTNDAVSLCINALRNYVAPKSCVQCLLLLVNNGLFTPQLSHVHSFHSETWCLISVIFLLMY